MKITIEVPDDLVDFYKDEQQLDVEEIIAEGWKKKKGGQIFLKKTGNISKG